MASSVLSPVKFTATTDVVARCPSDVQFGKAAISIQQGLWLLWWAGGAGKPTWNPHKSKKGSLATLVGDQEQPIGHKGGSCMRLQGHGTLAWHHFW